MGKKMLFLFASGAVALFVVAGVLFFFLQKENVVLEDERYSARVDRVDVTLELFKTGTYRLKTNDLVREGEYIRTQGYEDDVDAHLYILNPEHNGGEEMYYVRFSSEPNSIYILDSAQEVIKGSRLQRVE